MNDIIEQTLHPTAVKAVKKWQLTTIARMIQLRVDDQRELEEIEQVALRPEEHGSW